MSIIPHLWAHLGNRIVKRCAPLSIVHFVTSRCNARCTHCFMDFSAKSSRAVELSLGEIQALVRSLGKGLYNVNLTGGEPFLRDDLPAIAACYASTAVRSIVITTNGSFPGAIRSFLEEYRRCRSSCRVTISISLDDVEERHDSSRRLSGSYERALESYRLLKSWPDKRIASSIALTVTPANAARIETVFQTLRSERISSIFPILLREEGTQPRAEYPESLHTAYRRLSELVAQSDGTGSGRRSLAAAGHAAKNRIVRNILGDAAAAGSFHAYCTAGSLFATITSDGIVAPCELLVSQFPMGSLREHGLDFGRIWKNAAAARARQAIRESRCHCTFECAWTVNILARPVFWPKLALGTLKELV